MSCDKMKKFYFQFCKTFPQDLHKPKAFGGITKPQMKEPLRGGHYIYGVRRLSFWLGHLSNYRNRLRQLLITYIVNGVNCVQLILIADWFKLHSLLVHVTNIIKLASKIWILELRDWGKNRSTQIFPFTFPWHWKYKLENLALETEKREVEPNISEKSIID